MYVHLVGALAHPSWEARRLMDLGDRWADGAGRTLAADAASPAALIMFPSEGGLVATAPSATITCRETVEVLYSHFYIQDTGGAWLDDASLPQPAPPEDGDLVLAGPDWISILSGAQDHVAGIQLEVWEREPPPQPADWEVSADFELTCSTGTVVPVAVMMGPSEEEVTVGLPGVYHGRMYSRGRGLARDALLAADSIPDGTEEYVVQFWGV